MSDVFLEHLLTEPALQFPAQGMTDYGRHLFGEPAQIKSRWETITRVQQAVGEEVVVEDRVEEARVFASADMSIGDLLWRGDHGELAPRDLDDPAAIDGIYRVEKFVKTPSVDGGRFVRAATVRR